MNSGAAFLAAIAHPLTTIDSKIAFNEVSFGFVPHAGATFYMSRMPGEFGTFMALTGLSIRGSDAAVIDIARGIVKNTEDYDWEIADHVTSLPYPMAGGEDIFRLKKHEKVFVTPW
jgi:enoyl-CoA hydratase/carnithine racemase